MTVFIVIKNGEVDAVFSSRDAAENHKRNLTKQWSLSSIIERTVYDF